MARGFGWIPDEATVREADRDSRPLTGLVGGAGTSRPVAISYAGLLDRIIDQQGLNACVGVSLSTCIYLRGRAEGRRSMRRPSAKAIYDVARQNALFGGPLLDIGCRPRDAIEGIAKHGLVAEEEWPLFTDDEELLKLGGAPGVRDRWVNTEPPFDIFHQMFDAAFTGYARADYGDIIGALETALCQRQFPAFGMSTRTDYSHVGPNDVYDVESGAMPNGEPGHMQAICGYDADAFHIVSSWGETHGDGGIVRIAKSFIAGPFCFDRIVVTSVPLF